MLRNRDGNGKQITSSLPMINIYQFGKVSVFTSRNNIQRVLLSIHARLSESQRPASEGLTAPRNRSLIS